jgi:hypothetical protein
MAMALHGGGAEQNTKNRWFDKTLQFYVNTAGWAGMTYEVWKFQNTKIKNMKYLLN